MSLLSFELSPQLPSLVVYLTVIIFNIFVLLETRNCKLTTT